MTDNNNAGFYTDIVEDGYHIFSLKSIKIPNFYPNKFPNYPGVALNELSIGNRVTIRVFIRVGSGEPAKINGGLIDLEVELIDSDHIFGVILTKLPAGFPLETGSSLEVAEDEILYENKAKIQ